MIQAAAAHWPWIRARVPLVQAAPSALPAGGCLQGSSQNPGRARPAGTGRPCAFPGWRPRRSCSGILPPQLGRSGLPFPDPAGPCRLGINSRSCDPEVGRAPQRGGSLEVLPRMPCRPGARDAPLGQLQASVSSPGKRVWTTWGRRTEQAAPGLALETLLPHLTLPTRRRSFPDSGLRPPSCTTGGWRWKIPETLSPAAFLF